MSVSERERKSVLVQPVAKVNATHQPISGKGNRPALAASRIADGMVLNQGISTLTLPGD